MFSPALIGRAAAVLGGYRERAWRIATAESCTGGLVAGLLTEIPGSSDVIERGFVTYSNEAKVGLLGVPGELLAEHGAVSDPVARAMAEGALLRSNAHVAVSITGVAGPGGDHRVGLLARLLVDLAVEGGEVLGVGRRRPSKHEAVAQILDDLHYRSPHIRRASPAQAHLVVAGWLKVA